MVKFNLQVPTSFASVDCGSHGSSIFKSFVVLFRSALHMNHCWQWSISLIIKVSGMLIRSIHAQLEWMKVFINNIILRLSFSAISLWVSSSPGLSSLVLQPKVWASGCLIFPSTSMTALGAKRQTDRDRTQNQQRFISLFWNHSSINWRGRSLLIFLFLWPPPSFQTRSCSVAKLCSTLWLHELQHARVPCPSLSLRVRSH